MSDRRINERIKVNGISIEIFTKNHPIDGKFIGIVEDISTGGLLISVVKPFEPEPNRLFVSFNLPSGGNLAYIRARIAHAFKLGDRFAYGLAFFPLSNENKRYIFNFISTLVTSAD